MPSLVPYPGVSPARRLAAAVMTVVPALWGLSAFAAPPSQPKAVPVLAPRATAFAPPTGVFENSLRRRLESEARRQKLGYDLPFIAIPGDDIETLEPANGRRVERTILRALRGALDERIEEAARGSAGFAPLFRWIDGRDDGATGGFAGPSRMPGAESATGLGVGTPANSTRGVGDVALRFRLDAHPRILFGARLGAVSGRVELPLLEREVRLSLERPIGGHGRAALRGGRSVERGDWADLALHFSF